MRLNARYFGLSSALVAAATFILCALVVAFAPGAMQRTLSYVLHVDLTQMSRSISATSFFIGLVAFSAFFYSVRLLHRGALQRPAVARRASHDAACSASKRLGDSALREPNGKDLTRPALSEYLILVRHSGRAEASA